MPKDPAHLRVMSYNIHKSVGLDRRRNPARVARVIAGIAPEIVALQEVDRRLGARPTTLPPELLEEICGLQPAAIARRQVSLGWHGNTLLLARPWRMVRLERLPLIGLEPRGALIADLEGRGRLRIVATHLGLRRRDRQAQMTRIMAELAALPDCPTVLLGDLNEWSANKGFAPLDPYFTLHNPGRSFPARRPVAALDRVATGPGISVQQMGVARNGEAGRASDHLPIWADLVPGD